MPTAISEILTEMLSFCRSTRSSFVFNYRLALLLFTFSSMVWYSFLPREQRLLASQRPRVELPQVRMSPAHFVFAEPAAITTARAAGG